MDRALDSFYVWTEILNLEIDIFGLKERGK